MVLVTSGCGFFSDESSSIPKPNSSPAPAQEDKIDFAGAAKQVESAASKFELPATATVRAVKEEIHSAMQELGKDEDDIGQRCVDCSDDTKNRAVSVWKMLKGKLNSLDKEPQQLKELEEKVRTNLQRDLTAQAAELKKLSDAEPKRIGISTSATAPVKTDASQDSPWWWNALILSAKIIAVVLVVVLLVSAVNYLWNRSWKTLESKVGQLVKAHLTAAREAQPDFTPKLSSISSAQAEMSSKLTELNTEVRSLARLVRESLVTRRSDGNSSYSGLNYQSHMEDTPKEEPEFPVSAFDYLGKMNRFANVVRPDFQNGILVNDPEGGGELVLIRDSRDETQPLFVVPRATQFHTKEDFYTYYQKYYDCDRPSSGDVWILGPAVVEKVAGGWQLREKGMLEIR